MTFGRFFLPLDPEYNPFRDVSDRIEKYGLDAELEWQGLKKRSRPGKNANPASAPNQKTVSATDVLAQARSGDCAQHDPRVPGPKRFAHATAQGIIGAMDRARAPQEPPAPTGRAAEILAAAKKAHGVGVSDGMPPEGSVARFILDAGRRRRGEIR
jgi:hypothetical protein